MVYHFTGDTGISADYNFFASFNLRIVPNASVNFAISIGVNASPDFPPIVPRMPDIDFINDKV